MRPPLTGSAGYGTRGGGGFSGGRGASEGRSGGDLGGREPGDCGGSKVIVEPYRHAGVFMVKGKDSEEEALVTKNLLPGEAFYNEKIISVQEEDGTKVEYRKPGSKVLYLGASYGMTVSHVSDLVGPEGLVYAVEFCHKSGKHLVNMAKKRTNVIPIIEDAIRPNNYRVLVGMVDVIFCDVAQSDQASILALNASYFLKTGGHFVIVIKAKCIDPTLPAKDVFEKECNKLKLHKFSPAVQLTLEPFERDHACVVGGYRISKKQKTSTIA